MHRPTVHRPTPASPPPLHSTSDQSTSSAASSEAAAASIFCLLRSIACCRFSSIFALRGRRHNWVKRKRMCRRTTRLRLFGDGVLKRCWTTQWPHPLMLMNAVTQTTLMLVDPAQRTPRFNRCSRRCSKFACCALMKGTTRLGQKAQRAAHLHSRATILMVHESLVVRCFRSFHALRGWGI